MEGLLGTKFVKSEHVIPNGRIDSLGLDENNSPVIVEYKRGTNESVLSQALFYLDWLVNHKADFSLLVQQKLGSTYSEAIDWSRPRLICIAEGYTIYDRYAVNQINREIQLLQYSRLPGGLLLLEPLNQAANPFGNGNITTNNQVAADSISNSNTTSVVDKGHIESLASSEIYIREAFQILDDHLNSLGSDVERHSLKVYIAYRKVKNFACVLIRRNVLYLYLRLDPDSIELESGFINDGRNNGHHGTGDLEIVINSQSAAERALPLIDRAYSENL